MANEGNKWWKRRSKHGRDLIFSSPQLMWEAACECFEAIDNDTYWQKREVAAFQGEISTKTFPVQSPYSWEKLCLYFDCNTAYFRQYRAKLKKKKEDGIFDEVDDGFSTVIEMIGDVISSQQYDGATSGFFNGNLVSRYLGLKDKTEVSTPEDQTIKVTLKIE